MKSLAGFTLENLNRVFWPEIFLAFFLWSPSAVQAQPQVTAPLYPDSPLPPESAIYQLRDGASTRTGGFGPLDTGERDIVAAFYQSVYSASHGLPPEWTGNLDTCEAGQTSQEYRNAVLLRVNWYRTMAGVPDQVGLYPEYSAKAQQAALMMAKNGALNHFPPPTWDCYTDEGSDAASKSNLSLGRHGWEAVNEQMRDYGSDNGPVGHRRWILYPQTQLMGTGDIPPEGGNWSSNALWVIDSHIWDPRPQVRDEFVAWPPPGYVPYQVTPARWSFSWPDADFGSASVTMIQNGDAVSVVLESPHNGYGENTLVWVPEGLDPDDFFSTWPRPSDDVTYEVRIDNVLIDGQAQQFQYQVTVFDPDQWASLPLRITGPSVMDLSGASFNHQLAGFGEGYQMRALEALEYSGPEGAEDGGSRIIDNTNSDYQLISSQDQASGNFSFHLAHTYPDPQSFELDRNFLLGDTSVLRFKMRLGWATMNQVARVQISLDGGNSWRDLYSRHGTGGAGDMDFVAHEVSLAAYTGQVARFRVLYDYLGGSYYPQSYEGIGLYVDDIELGGVEEAGGITTSLLDGSGSFRFTPTSTGNYALQVRQVPWVGLPGLDWGPFHKVEVQNPAADADCSGDDVEVTTSFPANQVVRCVASNRIRISGDVKIPSTSGVVLEAPLVILSSGFRVESDGWLSVGPSP